MKILQIRLYREKCREGLQWRADVMYDGIPLDGLFLETEDDAVCTGVRKPLPEEIGACCRLLEDGERMDRICREVAYRYRIFLKSSPEILLNGQPAGPYLPSEDRAPRNWVVFHRTAPVYALRSFNYSANVVTGGVYVPGIGLVWRERETAEILLPKIGQVKRAAEVIADPEAWGRICAGIIAMFREGRSYTSVRIDEGDAPSAAVPVPGAADAPPAQEAPSPEADRPAAGEQAPVPGGSAEGSPEDEGGDGEREEGKEENRYGRIRNATDSALMKTIPGNVLRPVKMIEKLQKGEKYNPSRGDVQNCADGISSGRFTPQDIEILTYISRFRYLTSALLTDLSGSGCFSQVDGAQPPDQNHLNGRVQRMAEADLVTSCRFIGTDAGGNYDFSRISTAQIHTLGSVGDTLLKEFVRESRYRPLDMYQDGHTVRMQLCVNQWIIYWLAAYPEKVTARYGFDLILHRLGEELSGAKFRGWIFVGDQMLLGMPVRRFSGREKSAAEQELLQKAGRIRVLFTEAGGIYRREGDDRIPMELVKRPVIHYICEDEAHMREVIDLLRPGMTEGEENWFTYDMRLFNYEFEGSRFLKVTPDGEYWLDPGAVFGLGEERREEKRLDAEEAGQG